MEAVLFVIRLLARVYGVEHLLRESLDDVLSSNASRHLAFLLPLSRRYRAFRGIWRSGAV